MRPFIRTRPTADPCHSGQSVHAGRLCREICDDAGEKPDPEIASAGQACEADEGRQDILRLRGC